MACSYRFSYHPTHHAQVIDSSALTGKCHQHQPCRGRKQTISYRACRSEYIPLNIYINTNLPPYRNTIAAADLVSDGNSGHRQGIAWFWNVPVAAQEGSLELLIVHTNGDY